MEGRPHSNKIQRRILCTTLSCILAMCLIVSFASYYIFHTYLQQSMIHSTETSLQLLSDTINNSIDDVYRMARFCQNNTDIATYIEKASLPGSGLAVNTYDRMTEEYNSNPSNAYMPRVAVVTDDRFLQICNTPYSTTADLAQQIPGLPYYETLLSASGYDFSMGLVADPFIRKTKLMLPIIRPITYQYSSVQGGYLYMEISDELFRAPLKRYSIAEDSDIYLLLGEHYYRLENEQFTEVSVSYEILNDLTGSGSAADTSVTQVKNADGSRQILVAIPLNMQDCYIIQSISQQELWNQQLLFGAILGGILIGLLAIGIFLVFLMNRMIHTPLTKIREKINRISGGDFSRDPSIEWNHELGEIGRGINDLSENVYTLMNKRLEDEKQKKDLEYQMLQSQINPHFIYNTLNSIKWMATIQGSSGISEMTTSLARLLKSISKGTRLLVSIREELSLLEDYFTIQNYRYGGTIVFSIQVEDEKIYEGQIVKFTLQPLVENAIFHGIEPKGGAGHITIHAFYGDTNAGVPDIRIDVTDDGVGISQEKARQILLNNEESSADFFREIGVSNVQKRIQYEFGDSYGISIDSVEGSFTTMSIHIPFVAAPQAAQK